MTAQARTALAVIRSCLASDRFLVLPHFEQRMDERGLFWPDIEALFADASKVRSGGRDEWERPKWLVSGQTAFGDSAEVVCVLDMDAEGNMVVLITIYWNR